MKKILCYGDSNIYGFNPLDGTRYDENSRWTGILKNTLANEYEIIEEGLNNRTGFVKNPDGFLYSAQRHFPKILSKFQNIDIIILSIGTNDLQFKYDVNFKTIERGLENLILIAKEKSNNLILIPPVVLYEDILKSHFRNLFDETSIGKSKKVGKTYKKLAQIFNCKIFDINKFAEPSEIDGLHYDTKTHQTIATELSKYILEEFNDR